jgi:hypothetical protein
VRGVAHFIDGHFKLGPRFVPIRGAEGLDETQSEDLAAVRARLAQLKVPLIAGGTGDQVSTSNARTGSPT